MAKTKSPPKPKQRRPKQKPLPGMGEQVIQVIEDAGMNYEDLMVERVQASAKEKEAKDYLILAMMKHNVERYKMQNGEIIMISGTKNVKIVKPKEPQAE